MVCDSEGRRDCDVIVFTSCLRHFIRLLVIKRCIEKCDLRALELVHVEVKTIEMLKCRII